jgi:hypothetical protein
LDGTRTVVHGVAAQTCGQDRNRKGRIFEQALADETRALDYMVEVALELYSLRQKSYSDPEHGFGFCWSAPASVGSACTSPQQIAPAMDIIGTGVGRLIAAPSCKSSQRLYMVMYVVGSSVLAS